MDSVEVLLEEYKFLANVGEKYFDRMYSTINFTIIFYGAILTLVNRDNAQSSMILYQYFLPVGTYILGLFYAYNSYVITRQGYHMIRLEKWIRYYTLNSNNKISFLGWNILSKKYGGGYILAYGTSLMFFMLAPAFDFAYGWYVNSYKMFNSLIVFIFPIFFYIIYIIFMSIIIYNIFKMYKMTNGLLKNE